VACDVGMPVPFRLCIIQLSNLQKLCTTEAVRDMTTCSFVVRYVPAGNGHEGWGSKLYRNKGTAHWKTDLTAQSRGLIRDVILISAVAVVITETFEPK
jgi:hypothetical protein